jgi:hypothetical protein
MIKNAVSTLSPLFLLTLSYLLLGVLKPATFLHTIRDPSNASAGILCYVHTWRIEMALLIILAFLYPIKKEGVAAIVFLQTVRLLFACVVLSTILLAVCCIIEVSL